MIRKTFWTIVTLMLACSTASATDVRRVVTGLVQPSGSFDSARDFKI